MIERKYKINGMSCMHCVMAVKKELSKLMIYSSDVEIGSVTIIFEVSKVTEQQIKAAIITAGYEVVE